MLYPQYRQYVHTTIVNSVVVEAGRTYWIRRVCLRHVSRASFLSFTLLIARHNEETRLSLRPGRTIINLYYFQANKGTSRPPLDGRVMKTALLLLRHSLIKWRDGREFIIPLSTHILTLHRSHWERQCRCPHFPRQKLTISVARGKANSLGHIPVHPPNGRVPLICAPTLYSYTFIQ